LPPPSSGTGYQSQASDIVDSRPQGRDGSPPVRPSSELGHLFTRAELKVFALDELAQARAWIAAD